MERPLDARILENRLFAKFFIVLLMGPRGAGFRTLVGRQTHFSLIRSRAKRIEMKYTENLVLSNWRQKRTHERVDVSP